MLPTLQPFPSQSVAAAVIANNFQFSRRLAGLLLPLPLLLGKLWFNAPGLASSTKNTVHISNLSIILRQVCRRNIQTTWGCSAKWWKDLELHGFPSSPVRHLKFLLQWEVHLFHCHLISKHCCEIILMYTMQPFVHTHTAAVVVQWGEVRNIVLIMSLKKHIAETKLYIPMCMSACRYLRTAKESDSVCR